MDYEFRTPSGIVCRRTATHLDYQQGIPGMLEALDQERGILLSSGIEYPGRYTRWDIGFIRPPLEFVSRDRELRINALNERGSALIDLFADVLTADPNIQATSRDRCHLALHIAVGTEIFPEEERSFQPTVFTPLRLLFGEFKGVEDSMLGVYGAFGHDLIFQFEPIDHVHARPKESKEMHLFLPDSIFLLDRRKETLVRFDYSFSRGDQSTAGLNDEPFVPLQRTKGNSGPSGEVTSPHNPESYAAMVEAARGRMQVGDIYELVLHRRFSVDGEFLPSAVWRTMSGFNPSPYEFLCQFGDEQLVGTSPEMFIRVSGDRVESCPISGTVRRGENAMEDAEEIRRLINSEKDEVELTMCTDVDRNDKARICVPGSVKLLDRRVIERYAGLFHTVDHVEGQLRPGMTGIDAFMSHMWAVTLTGSPKPMAVRLIEQMETEPREWYGGAVGALLFNGDTSTGITIRTVHLKNGQAHYRVGATLVYDSNGNEEEQETRTKATVFFHLLDKLRSKAETQSIAVAQDLPGKGLRLLLIDNEDSFVHILADYFRQTGAEVVTYRHGLNFTQILESAPDLVIHSPGPGRPEDFGLPDLVRRLAAAGIPQFGVCLGLQGIVEAFGGQLALLAQPRQGKRWTVSHDGTHMFSGLPSPCVVGAYHALYADDRTLPDCLEILSRNEIGVVMAVRHRQLPISAVQFHPESILSMRESVGYRLIANVMTEVRKRR
ncbi:anthranilate synthase component I [Fluviibacter phosphoraccumulans]|uniref:anthranilate synthase component I n=1 Tax=Fluviibacter phosphoraccumulans TaxID=1751046 RepID=UPI0010B27AD1|nr:anthranilate synthase component I [Fluviibacter phosphoraccumulans]BCA64664.1 anthranilate synthase component I [Fluviibacter phosphoraccumulans]